MGPKGRCAAGAGGALRFPPRKFVSTRGPTQGNELFRQKPRIARFLGEFVSALYHTPPARPETIPADNPVNGYLQAKWMALQIR
jgi:hypothetical protein